jgi:RNA polymerase sigma factor (sigma-70 family)
MEPTPTPRLIAAVDHRTGTVRRVVRSSRHRALPLPRAVPESTKPTRCSARCSAPPSRSGRRTTAGGRTPDRGSTASRPTCWLAPAPRKRRIHATARLLSRQPPAGDPADEIVADLDARQLWPRVADAVAGLPEEERDALLLFVWEELSYEDIALALGVPVGTVRSRLNRARVSLRELRASIGRET